MRIAVNTRFLLPHKMEGFGWYTYEITKRLVEQHPEHTFIFLFDRPYDYRFIFGENVIPVVLFPPARHPFLFIIWFELAVRRALKKYQADVFFSPDGYLSLGSDCPQINVIHDLNFEHLNDAMPVLQKWYYRYFFPKFAKKAKKIVTVSNYSKADIASTYSIPTHKITAIWNGASEQFKPLSEDEKRAVRTKLTGGKNYFLFVGALHPRKNLSRLLEAYSIYKSDSKNQFELVIVGTSLWKNAFLADKVPDTMKQYIHFTGHLPLSELANVMGAASIFTYIPYFEGFGIPLVEAMRCGIPIISGNLTSLPEVAGEAAVYCDPFDVQDVAKKMIELSRDEQLQSSLSQKSMERSQLFSWDKAAEQVWHELTSIYEH